MKSYVVTNLKLCSQYEITNLKLWSQNVVTNLKLWSQYVVTSLMTASGALKNKLKSYTAWNDANLHVKFPF